MDFNFRGKYDSTLNYTKKDVVSFQPNVNGSVTYHFCLTDISNTNPQTPDQTDDTLYWGLINSQSNFPNSVDNFLTHTSLSASDKTDLSRFQTLSMQTSLTPSEQDELSGLTQKLRNKLITGEDFNALQDSISNMQMYLKDSVIGYIDQKQAEMQAKIDKFSDKGVYSSATTYQATNFVTYQDETYICLADNTVAIPPTDTTKWRKAATRGAKGDAGLGANYKGEYNSATGYVLGDAVSYQGIIYYAKQAVSGIDPTDNTNWQLFDKLIIDSSAPSAPPLNQAWLDTANKKIKYWDGTSWNENNASNSDKLGNQSPSYYATAQNLTNHQNDFVFHTNYGSTTNIGNAYSVTLSSAPTAYIDGMSVSVKINADSTGNSTINVNGLGAKPIKKPNGIDVINLKTNGIYTFRYNSTTGNFILQGEGAYGNATASDLLSGKTASTDVGDITGTMPNRSNTTITPSNVSQYIPMGYHYNSTVVGDANLIPGNIVVGTSIFGVVGSYNGKKWANGTVTTNNSNNITVTGLDFEPSYVLVYENNTLQAIAPKISGDYTACKYKFDPNTFYDGSFNRTSNGFTIQVYQSNYSDTFSWIAFE